MMASLPEGWFRYVTSESHEEYPSHEYYHNAMTGESRWTEPALDDATPIPDYIVNVTLIEHMIRATNVAGEVIVEMNVERPFPLCEFRRCVEEACGKVRGCSTTDRDGRTIELSEIQRGPDQVGEQAPTFANVKLVCDTGRLLDTELDDAVLRVGCCLHSLSVEPLPDGWREYTRPRYRTRYYAHMGGQTTWLRPLRPLRSKSRPLRSKSL